MLPKQNKMLDDLKLSVFDPQRSVEVIRENTPYFMP